MFSVKGLTAGQVPAIQFVTCDCPGCNAKGCDDQNAFHATSTQVFMPDA